MNLLQLSKREKFYFYVGEALSINNTRCFINQETSEVEIHPGENYYSFDEEDPAQDALNNPDKYRPVEQVLPSQAFKVMAGFAQTVKDKQMKRRLTGALNGRKPFANFNHLVHSTNVREQRFSFKNKSYTEMAKEWIDENANQKLKEKLKALPALSSV